ncbi:MAG TPA: DNA repair protein RecO [Polyangia bacterium]|nr:DNA repair protein RecO [Polyangia bacterium]
MPALSTPAIVLRAVNYGEADRVVTLFGRDIGRVSALARSARKSQVRFAGGLGLGAVGMAALRERPGAEMLTLESFAASSATHVALGTDVARLAHASYAVELVTKLCAPRQAEPAVYDWLAEMLERLAGGTPTAERLRVFELGLLRGLGFQPVVDRCAVCATADPAAPFRWDPDRGGALCAGCARSGRPIAAATRAALVRLEHLSLGEAEAVSLPADVNRGCREALFEIMNQHLNGPLKSLEFIAKLSQSP